MVGAGTTFGSFGLVTMIVGQACVGALVTFSTIELLALVNWLVLLTSASVVAVCALQNQVWPVFCQLCFVNLVVFPYIAAFDGITRLHLQHSPCGLHSARAVQHPALLKPILQQSPILHFLHKNRNAALLVVAALVHLRLGFQWMRIGPWVWVLEV